jgi:hypothetical protein
MKEIKPGQKYRRREMGGGGCEDYWGLIGTVGEMYNGRVWVDFGPYLLSQCYPLAVFFTYFESLEEPSRHTPEELLANLKVKTETAKKAEEVRDEAKDAVRRAQDDYLSARQAVNDAKAELKEMIDNM